MAGDHRQKGFAVGLWPADSDFGLPGIAAQRRVAAIGGLILVAVLTAAGFTAGNLFLRPSLCNVPIETLRRDLNLTNLTLMPSGRVLRYPDSVHPGIDLRYCPLLPPIQTDPATLIINSEQNLAP